MISTAILTLLYYAVSALLSPLLLLPDVELSQSVISAITSAGSYVSILDIIIPVGTLVTILGLMVAVEVAVFTYKLIKWAYSKIPGIN